MSDLRDFAIPTSLKPSTDPFETKSIPMADTIRTVGNHADTSAGKQGSKVKDSSMSEPQGLPLAHQVTYQDSNDGEAQNVEEKVYLVRDIATTKELSQGDKFTMIISGFLAFVILMLTVTGVTLSRNHDHRVWRLILLGGSIGTSIALTVLMKAADRTLPEIISLVTLFWTVFPKQMEGLVSDVNPGQVYG